MTKSMTAGNPLRLILQFALPLLVGNLLQQTYNIMDAAIVGHILGANALASVGASSSVQFLVLGFCIGLCCGFGIPIAQCFGAGNYDKMRHYIYHAALLTALTAVVLTSVCTAFCPKILHLLQTPEPIYADAYRYLLVIFLGIPASLLYNLLSSILRSVGDSRTPFLFLALSTVLNIGLDLFCILVLGWGCAGAAIATITAQGVSGILCFLFIQLRFKILHLNHNDCYFNGNTALYMFIMGAPMGLQYSITAVGCMVMQSANNALGSVYVSGFTAANRLKQFFMCPFDAIATATSVFCGQNLGAGRSDRIHQGIFDGSAIGVLYGTAAGLLLLRFGRTLSLLFISADSPAVLDASTQYLHCMGFLFWTLGILNVCRMSTQGLGYSGRAIFSGLTEMLARVGASVFLVPLLGYTAICWTDQCAWVAACFYIVPTCVHCLKKVHEHMPSEQPMDNADLPLHPQTQHCS